MVSLLHDSTEVLIKAEEVSRVVLAFAARPVAPIQGGSDRYQFQFMVMTHLVRVGIEIKPTVSEVGDGPPFKVMLVVEQSPNDGLAAAASGRDLCRPEEVVVGAVVCVAQANQHVLDYARPRWGEKLRDALAEVGREAAGVYDRRDPAVGIRER